MAASSVADDILDLSPVCLDYLKATDEYKALPPAANPAYIGCYRDNEGGRDLPHLGSWGSNRVDSDGFTKDQCASYCSSEGYIYMGRQYWFECFCGDSYGRFGPRVPDDCACNDPQQIGGDRNCVYRLDPDARTVIQVRKELFHKDKTFRRCLEMFDEDGESGCHEATFLGRLTESQLEKKKSDIAACTAADVKAKVECMLRVYDEYVAKLDSEGHETLGKCLKTFSTLPASSVAIDIECNHLAMAWMRGETPAVALGGVEGIIYWFTHLPETGRGLAIKRRQLYATCREVFSKGLDPACKAMVSDPGATVESFVSAYLALSPEEKQAFQRCRLALPVEAGDKCLDTYLSAGAVAEVQLKCDGCGCCKRKVLGPVLAGAPTKDISLLKTCLEIALETPERNCLEVNLKPHFGDYQADVVTACAQGGPSPTTEAECVVDKLITKFKALQADKQAELQTKCFP